MSKKKNEILANRGIEVSESGDGIELKITGDLCYLNHWNLNGFKLSDMGENFEKSVQSLVNKPIVARYTWDEDIGGNFTSHEMYEDWLTGEIRFGTEAIGTITAVSVQNKMVKPVYLDTEIELPVIVYEATIWEHRFPEFAKVIRKLYTNGELGTSWELSPNTLVSDEDCEIEGIPNPRTSDDWTFLGNALLGEGIRPAYSGTSKITNVASVEISESSMVLANAMHDDIINRKSKLALENADKQNNENEGGKGMKKTLEELQKELDTANAKVLNYEKAGTEVAIKALEKKVLELETSKGEVEDKFVTATQNIVKLQATVEELEPFKVQVEAINLEKAKAEKVEMIEKLTVDAKVSKMFSEKELAEDEALLAVIKEGNEKGLRLMIAEKVIQKARIENANEEKTNAKPNNAGTETLDNPDEKIILSEESNKQLGSNPISIFLK